MNSAAHCEIPPPPQYRSIPLRAGIAEGEPHRFFLMFMWHRAGIAEILCARHQTSQKAAPGVKIAPRRFFGSLRVFLGGFNVSFMRGVCTACLRAFTEGVRVPHFEVVPAQQSAPGHMCTTSLKTQTPFALRRCKSLCNLRFGRYKFGKVQKWVFKHLAVQKLQLELGWQGFVATQETPHVLTTPLEPRISLNQV